MPEEEDELQGFIDLLDLTDAVAGGAGEGQPAEG